MNAEKDQLITLAHSMEVSYSALDAEAGLSYDTTVRVSVQPNRYYPDYVAVTLLWLASSHIFHGIEEFNRFRDDFEDRPEERYQQIMDSWPLVFGSTEKAMKKLFAPVFAVVRLFRVLAFHAHRLATEPDADQIALVGVAMQRHAVDARILQSPREVTHRPRLKARALFLGGVNHSAHRPRVRLRWRWSRSSAARWGTCF